MNDEIEPIHIGEIDDIDVGSVENFEYEEINYAIYKKDHAWGSAYYDLEILQTPVLEAFTNNTSNLKTKLIISETCFLDKILSTKENFIFAFLGKIFASKNLPAVLWYFCTIFQCIINPIYTIIFHS